MSTSFLGLSSKFSSCFCMLSLHPFLHNVQQCWSCYFPVISLDLHDPSNVVIIIMSKVQQTARRYANEYWTQLSQEIQTAAITGNIKGMYDGIKKALGLARERQHLKPSNGEIITGKGQQMERWVEHYILASIPEKTPCLPQS